MKTKFILFLTLFLCGLLCQSQTVWLYTSYGSQVYAFSNPEGNDIEYLNSVAKNGYPKATFLETATYTYNCHSYAWNMKEGGPICWLNQYPDLHWYWDDLSYDLLQSDANATKIFYYSGDHSAVKSSVSGMYESKWGQAQE